MPANSTIAIVAGDMDGGTITGDWALGELMNLTITLGGALPDNAYVCILDIANVLMATTEDSASTEISVAAGVGTGIISLNTTELKTALSNLGGDEPNARVSVWNSTTSNLIFRKTIKVYDNPHIQIADTSDVDAQDPASHARQHALDGTSDHTSTITADFLIKANANGLPTAAVDSAWVDQDVSSGAAPTLDGSNISDTPEAFALLVHARKGSAGTITKGSPVYVAGWNAGLGVVEVEEADADDVSKMPVLGLAWDNLTNAATGHVISAGNLTGFDTSAYSVGNELYVSTTAGALTATRPPGPAALVQKVAQVLRSHATLGVITVFGAGRANDFPNVLRHTFIPAGAKLPRTTNGAEAATVEYGTNDVVMDHYDFDNATKEAVQCTGMLERWNAGTFKAKVVWTAAAGSGDCTWGISARAYADDDAIDQAFGTEIDVTDTILATGDVHFSPATAAITAAGTPANGQLLQVQVAREASGVANDVRIIGVVIEYAETTALEAAWA